MSLRWPPKDKDEVLDYSIDWSRFLVDGEFLSTSSWFIKDADGNKVSFVPGVTVDGLKLRTQTRTATVATVFLSDGTDNQEYTIFCLITTTEGREAERPVKIRIREYN